MTKRETPGVFSGCKTRDGHFSDFRSLGRFGCEGTSEWAGVRAAFRLCVLATQLIVTARAVSSAYYLS